MSYHISKKLDTNFDDAIEQVKNSLKNYGFGIITEIDMQKTIKEKINKSMQPYKILGACNPEYAYKAITSEDKIGLLLPCNVIVQQHDDNQIEVSAIDPVTSMQGVDNKSIEPIALEIRNLLQQAVESL